MSNTNIAIPVSMFLLALLPPTAASAAEFGARAVMQTPQGTVATAKLFVSEGRMRKEYDYHGEPVVEILDSTSQKAWMCFRAQQACFETRSLDTLESGAERPFPANPCEGARDLSCRRLAEERINGRPAIKWEVREPAPGGPVITHQWIDTETHLPIRRELPNGVVIELLDQGEESIQGRKTTKWKVVTRFPDGREETMYQWFDRDLGIAIRQEIPGSGSQELRDIRVGAVPDRLFETPAGYRVFTEAESQASSRVR